MNDHIKNLVIGALAIVGVGGLFHLLATYSPVIFWVVPILVWCYIVGWSLRQWRL